ncbi:MAG: GNAT family N-acetyltransferase [Chitinophagales bacterium]|nr:GNAT family N-acetyltransferase [Chitinophagales bacterium]
MKESLHIIARRFVVSAESFLKLLEAFDTWQYKSISLIYIIIVYWLKPEDYVHQDYYYVVSAVKLLSAILAAFILLSKPIIKFFEGLLDSVKFDLGQIKIPDDFALVIDGKVTKGEFSASFVDKDSYKVHIMSTGTMGDLAFGGLSYLELGDRCNMYEKWYLHNNSSIVNLYHNDKPIGYVIVLAMRNGIQNRHYKGDVSQFNLDRTSMCPTGEKSNLVYIQALVVKRGYRKNKFVKALVNDALKSRQLWPFSVVRTAW